MESRKRTCANGFWLKGRKKGAKICEQGTSCSWYGHKILFGGAWGLHQPRHTRFSLLSADPLFFETLKRIRQNSIPSFTVLAGDFSLWSSSSKGGSTYGWITSPLVVLIWKERSSRK